jgi:hypothetical protein
MSLNLHCSVVVKGVEIFEHPLVQTTTEATLNIIGDGKDSWEVTANKYVQWVKREYGNEVYSNACKAMHELKKKARLIGGTITFTTG